MSYTAEGIVSGDGPSESKQAMSRLSSGTDRPGLMRLVRSKETKVDREPHAFREVTAVGGGCFYCNRPRGEHEGEQYLELDGIWPMRSGRFDMGSDQPKRKGKKHWVTSKSRDRQRGRDAKYWTPMD